MQESELPMGPFCVPLNSTHYAMLYPQNGDCIVAIDSVTVTSLHPMYSLCVFNAYL